jgi:hypothetical protein
VSKPKLAASQQATCSALGAANRRSPSCAPWVSIRLSGALPPSRQVGVSSVVLEYMRGCVCVCVCVCARACVCVRVCANSRKTNTKQFLNLLFLLRLVHSGLTVHCLHNTSAKAYTVHHNAAQVYCTSTTPQQKLALRIFTTPQQKRKMCIYTSKLRKSVKPHDADAWRGQRRKCVQGHMPCVCFNSCAYAVQAPAQKQHLPEV